MAQASFVGPLSKAARDALITKHQGSAVMLARAICSTLPSFVDREELEGAALLGLVQAADRYDPAQNDDFRLYAAPRVRGAIKDALRRLDWMPRRPRVASRMRSWASQTMLQELGRPPTRDELRERMRWLTGNPADADYHPSIESIDDRPAEDFDLAAPEHAAEKSAEFDDLIEFALAGMKDRDRAILYLLLVEGATQRQVGPMFGVTESRISQVHRRLKATLREKLKDYGPAPK